MGQAPRLTDTTVPRLKSKHAVKVAFLIIPVSFLFEVFGFPMRYKANLLPIKKHVKPVYKNFSLFFQKNKKKGPFTNFFREWPPRF